MGRDAEPSHTGDSRTAKIVQPPAVNSGAFVELGLSAAELPERLLIGSEDVGAVLGTSFKDPHRGRSQMHEVRLGVLGARARERPEAVVEIDLIPGHAGDLHPPLSCEREKLDEAAVGAPDLTGSPDDLTELIISQHAIARRFLGRLPHPLTGRTIDDRPAYAPSEEALCYLQGLVGGYRCSVDNLTDELDDVASGHIVDRSRTPAAHDLAFQDAGDLAGRA